MGRNVKVGDEEMDIYVEEERDLGEFGGDDIEEWCTKTTWMKKLTAPSRSNQENTNVVQLKEMLHC